MKTLVRLLLIVCLGGSLLAQENADNAESAEMRSSEELDKLVAPIALYPDALVALILPASTASADVVLAARFLAQSEKPGALDQQPWSESVRSLARYPSIVAWMNENLEWTRTLGETFVMQPADVMNAIQRLRAHARATGLLTDTSEQRVVVENDVIRILPAAPDVIYVPYYDSDILWMRRGYSGSFVSFSSGFVVGSWLFYDCDWPSRVIVVHHHHHHHPHWKHHSSRREPAGIAPRRVWHPARHHLSSPRPVRPISGVIVRSHATSSNRTISSSQNSISDAAKTSRPNLSRTHRVDRPGRSSAIVAPATENPPAAVRAAEPRSRRSRIDVERSPTRATATPVPAVSESRTASPSRVSSAPRASRSAESDKSTSTQDERRSSSPRSSSRFR